MFSKFLRLFWDVYLIKDMNSNKYYTYGKGFESTKPEDGTNLILLKMFLDPVCKYYNVKNPERYLRVKRMWMPYVRIDGSIKSTINKKNEGE